jgi:hypothetical protein
MGVKNSHNGQRKKGRELQTRPQQIPSKIKVCLLYRASHAVNPMCVNDPLHVINIRKNISDFHGGCHIFADKRINSSPFVGAGSSLIVWRLLLEEEKPVG